jgi:hypothetical protein
MPQGFLEDVLDLRMEIEEAKEEAGRDVALVGRLADQVSMDRESAMQRVAQAFEMIEKAPVSVDPKALVEVRKQLNTVKYLDGLLRELDALQQ